MQLMNRIEPDSMKTFEIDDYFVHYINDDGISAVCMTDKKINKKQAFAFLQDVKKALLNYYTATEIQKARAYQLETFTETIKDKIEFYNSNPVGYSDKTDQLFNELNNLKAQMIENLDKSLERGGKIEITLQRSESLIVTSRTYKTTSTRVRKTMRNRRYYYIACFIVTLLFLILFISMCFCGFTFQDCRSSS